MLSYSEYFDLVFTALKTQAASGGARAMQISWVGKQQIPALLTDTGLVQPFAWKAAREREGSEIQMQHKKEAARLSRPEIVIF